MLAALAKAPLFWEPPVALALALAEPVREADEAEPETAAEEAGVEPEVAGAEEAPPLAAPELIILIVSKVVKCCRQPNTHVAAGPDEPVSEREAEAVKQLK